MEARYEHDVTPAWDVSPTQLAGSRGGESIEGSIYNETFYFLVGFRFWTSRAKAQPELVPVGGWLPVNAPAPS